MSGFTVDRNVPAPEGIDDKVSDWIKDQSGGDAINSAELRRYLLNVSRIGSWTPSITFTTPGNLVLSGVLAFGEYCREGRYMNLTGLFVGGMTFTTASGNLQITGIPRAIANVSNLYQPVGACEWSGITKANYTQIVVVGSAAGTVLNCQASGSGQALSTVTAADIPSGGTLRLGFSIRYRF